VEDLSSNLSSGVANDMDCRLGDAALETLEGDTDRDKLRGDPRGVS